ncbi:hypothetical protein QWY93_05620 [Echinicola jeungdonensis]|uniref:Por secretion system C-terminal sorting domain-containing protein n=1 Tax=Echinicola jeungdonensis TaxID=709343 RepID=A0ABV5J4W4_9BACT|nr:hypothetical protein [Echinicola jeungdonensis]MDN3668801.1 hypothetical protein [Echinicola jeungdonensis]
MSRPQFLIFLFLGLVMFGFKGWAQTFTYDSSNMGCDGNWGTGACWDIDNVDGCASPQNAPPPLDGTGCEVNIVINEDLSYMGDMEFGGAFGGLTIANGAHFELEGNAIIASDKKMDFILNGGSEFNINGELVVSLGGSSDSTKLTIDGDEDSYVLVNSIDLQGRAVLELEEGGALISSGPTEYNGNSSKINVYGFFRTQMIDIQGGSNHQLNSYGNAEILIEEDIVLGGSSGISFNGDSEVYVGGDINNSNGAEIIASDNAKVYYCGAIKKEEAKTEKDNGEFLYGCRTLPVEWGEIHVDIAGNNQAVLVSWTSLKEWENDHFIIERSVGGVDHFENIHKETAVGWSEVPSQYHFEDKDLPLGGERIYYRIKQVGINGEFHYSPIYSVQLPEVQSSQGNWRVYPNPSRGKTVEIGLLNSDQYNSEEITIRVFNAITSSQPLTIESLGEINPSIGEIIRKFPKGLVIIEIQWADQVEYLKLIN